MKTVFVLQHVTPHDDGGEDVKFIGVYRTEESATFAVQRLSNEPGFREHTDGFTLDEYELDLDHWTDGFGAEA